MNQRDEAVTQDIEERFGLFSEIMLDRMPIPTMPQNLVPYDYPISRIQAQREARAVFLIWLNGKINGFYHGMSSDDPLPCSDAGLMDSFFPDWPDALDFEDGADSINYRRLEAEAGIDTAIAKRACDGCPLRLQCLARALKADTEYPRDVAPEFEGVAGGWGPGAREVIFNRFEEIRRAYVRGVKEERWGMPISERKGMSQRQIETAVRECSALSSSA